MPILDTQRIIEGTPSKRLRLAHQELKENYTTENVERFSTVLESLSLSDLLSNSRYVFSEAKVGLPFYQQVMESGCLPFSTYYDERKKVEEFVEAHKDHMNTTTKAVFESLVDSLKTLEKNHFHAIICEQVLNENEEDVMKFCESAYHFLQTNTGLEEVKESFAKLSPRGKTLYGLERASDLELEYEIVSEMTQMMSESPALSDIDDYSTSISTMMFSKNLLQDQCMQESLENIPNKIQRMKLQRVMVTESVSDVLEETISYHKPFFYSGEVRNIQESVNMLFEMETSPYTSVYGESAELEIYEGVLRQYIAYEKCLDYLMSEYMVVESENAIVSDYDLVKEYAKSHGYDEILTVDQALAMMTEATAELEERLVAMEYSKDGSQSTAIQNHATNLREARSSKKPKDNDADAWKESLDDANEESEENPKAGKSKEKDKKPEMNKKDFHIKIQSAALDADIKAKSLGSKMKKLGSDVVQTGKAILKVPGNIVNSIKGMISGWNDWDETKRKEYMLKPGYRKKFYKSLKWAISYGVSAMINPLFVILTYFCRKASSEKNMFIRNELARELETEIKVCEQKIENAKNNNDEKEVYQLMRIRDKLEGERVRVVANGKYV